MFVVQNENRPGEIQNALHDLMQDSIDSVRICSAYITESGSEILFDIIRRSAKKDDVDKVEISVVTSLDFGITEPKALEFWVGKPNCSVSIAGAYLLKQGNLNPNRAFHPKLYVVNKTDGSVGSLVGSANLTNRGLTINSEAGWCETCHADIEAVDKAWDAAVHSTVSLTPTMFKKYRALHKRVPRARPSETERVPKPKLVSRNEYKLFADFDSDLSTYKHMWVKATGMQGGSGAQLELPRHACRFFGVAFDGYEKDHVVHIAEPILVSGQNRWEDCLLRWHGNNRMERFNLPTVAKGGFEYENSLILFRRMATNTFELRVYPWDSDTARAYVEASRRADLVFRVGQSSNRLAGFA